MAPNRQRSDEPGDADAGQPSQALQNNNGHGVMGTASRRRPRGGRKTLIAVRGRFPAKSTATLGGTQPPEKGVSGQYRASVLEEIPNSAYPGLAAAQPLDQAPPTGCDVARCRRRSPHAAPGLLAHFRAAATAVLPPALESHIFAADPGHQPPATLAPALHAPPNCPARHREKK
eukprot:CAMPEP_0173381736 /NCGR_PEP_ID=MMETSP1356-20130122/4147_1 /TAXON_ID=77927 ORGANISM="Hemiselmis virescens, Strain PCC157" /NCGR_SAMPLE_ID=MMETSP1356 /ASSEMBLY_ACC=CAM_ASM_000847 /LENGTH=173 /DNA_ID=CAMNT_0014335707 /DNA_START=175 /DNA_END=694 /DNA_ORIENTATION=+